MAAGLNTKGKMSITELDFDSIKSNLKTYLKGQSEFITMLLWPICRLMKCFWILQLKGIR